MCTLGGSVTSPPEATRNRRVYPSQSHPSRVTHHSALHKGTWWRPTDSGANSALSGYRAGS